MTSASTPPARSGLPAGRRRRCRPGVPQASPGAAGAPGCGALADADPPAGAAPPAGRRRAPAHPRRRGRAAGHRGATRSDGRRTTRRSRRRHRPPGPAPAARGLRRPRPARRAVAGGTAPPAAGRARRPGRDGGRRSAAPAALDAGGAAGPGPARAGRGLPRRLGDVRGPVGQPDRRHAGGHVQVRRRRRRWPRSGRTTSTARSSRSTRCPQHVRQAVLAAEDRSFYSNPGFDPPGIARALYNQLTGGVGGGSTITQQYVKVSTGQDQASLWRKYKEIILSIKISKEQTQGPDPRELPQHHLLRPRRLRHPGRGAGLLRQGRQDLTIAEGAMLAGMIQSPSRSTRRRTPRVHRSVELRRSTGWSPQGWLPARRAGPAEVPATCSPPRRRAAACPPTTGGHIYERGEAELRANGISSTRSTPAASSSPRRSTRTARRPPSTPSTR